MAVTRITRTRGGTGAINYVLKPKARNKERVLAISGSNVSVTRTIEQMSATRESFGRDRINRRTGEPYIQAYRLIQSFSDKELNPNNPEDVQKCNAIGHALAKELYPDHQVLVVTHGDGVGEKLHNHLVINATSFMTGKQLRGDAVDWDYVAPKSDEVLKRFGMEPIEKKAIADDRRTQAEVKSAEKGKYVWKDDLKARISSVMGEGDVYNRSDFIELMNDAEDIEVEFKGKGKMTVLYKFVDKNGKAQSSRGDKLGNIYNTDNLEKQMVDNLKGARALKVEPATIDVGVDFKSYMRAVERNKELAKADPLTMSMDQRRARRGKKQSVKPIETKPAEVVVEPVVVVVAPVIEPKPEKRAYTPAQQAFYDSLESKHGVIAKREREREKSQAVEVIQAIEVPQKEEAIKESVEAPKIVEVVAQQQQKPLIEKVEKEVKADKQREHLNAIRQHEELIRIKELKELEDMRKNYNEVKNDIGFNRSGETVVKSRYWYENGHKVPLTAGETKAYKTLRVEKQAKRKAEREIASELER